MDLPVGQFPVIVADPPWPTRTGPMSFGSMGEGFIGGSKKSQPLNYPTLTIPEISALPVGTCTAPSAELYLWTINRFVEDAYSVARAWGFTPSTLLTWSKKPMGGGLGGRFGLSMEFCLYARKGTPPKAPRHTGTVFTWKRPMITVGSPDTLQSPQSSLPSSNL